MIFKIGQKAVIENNHTNHPFRIGEIVEFVRENGRGSFEFKKIEGDMPFIVDRYDFSFLSNETPSGSTPLIDWDSIFSEWITIYNADGLSMRGKFNWFKEQVSKYIK